MMNGTLIAYVDNVTTEFVSALLAYMFIHKKFHTVLKNY